MSYIIGNNIITYLRYTPVTAHNKRIYWMTTSTVVANRARDSAGKRTFHARALTRSAAFVAATVVADAFAAATHHVDRSLDSRASSVSFLLPPPLDPLLRLLSLTVQVKSRLPHGSSPLPVLCPRTYSTTENSYYNNIIVYSHTIREYQTNRERT